MLKVSIPDLDNLHKRLGIDDFSWIEEFSGAEGVFTQLIQEYENNIRNFEKLIKQFKRENDLTKAAMCERKLQHYKKNKLIDFLARGNILPRYGFPVNTVELQQNTTANNVSKLRLSRDLQIAIAEYAPSSEVVADGRLYTSRYIKKSATGKDKQDWYTGYIGTCRNKDCNTVNYSITPITSEGIPCSACGRKLFKMDFYESIEPRSGFVAERQDRDVPMTRQEKNYRSEDYYIGNIAARTIDKHRYLFNSIEIQVESTTNDSLMVAKHGHGVSDLLHLHAACADGTATVVLFQLAVLFHGRKVTVNARNGNSCSGCDVTHRGCFTVASVVFVDVIQDDLLFRIGSSTHRFSLEQIVPFDVITQDFPLVNRVGTKCSIFFAKFFRALFLWL